MPLEYLHDEDRLSDFPESEAFLIAKQAHSELHSDPLGRLHMRPLQQPFHSLGLTNQFPGGVHDFHGCLYPGLGCPHGGFPDPGYLDPFRTQAPHQYFGVQGGN